MLVVTFHDSLKVTFFLYEIQKNKKSEESVNSSLSKHKMNVPLNANKSKIMLKRSRTRTQKKIQKLFNALRKDTESISEIPKNDTVINISSCDDTIITQPQTSVKRKTSSLEIDTKKRRRKSDDSLIIINDDEISSANKPLVQGHIDCSTPIRTRSKETIQGLIKDNFCHSKTNNNLSIVKNSNVDAVKEINMDSYLTIDLTADSNYRDSEFQTTRLSSTVIDVENEKCNIDTQDCAIVSVSSTSLSMSGDSEVTVLNANRQNDKEMKKFANGIAKLNASQKGKLLEFMAQNIFGGCNVSMKLKNSLTEIKQATSRATETVEDTYIKEVILGETPSRNSVGSNIYRPSRNLTKKEGLRMVVIDGSNVAMEHTKGRIFSVNGLKICIDYFVRRGHVVKAFVPRFRCKFGKSSDPRLLDSLERQGLVVYTPSREIQGRNVVSYDDRYILQCAAEFDGVIVSGDNYRDLMSENPRWKFVIENRLLPFTWVEDMIMFPKDPLGRNGPKLEQFLRHPQNGPSIVL